jgi:hypothetical protein
MCLCLSLVLTRIETQDVKVLVIVVQPRESCKLRQTKAPCFQPTHSPSIMEIRLPKLNDMHANADGEVCCLVGHLIESEVACGVQIKAFNTAMLLLCTSGRSNLYWYKNWKLGTKSKGNSMIFNTA